MNKNQKGQISVGQFFTHKNPKKKSWDYCRNQIMKIDEKIPIVANMPMTRMEIFDKLWVATAESIATRFLSKNEYEAISGLHWIVVEQKIGAVVHILAYVLSKKKPAGLASKSKNSQTDKVLATIRASLRRLDQVTATNDLKEYYPKFEKDFAVLRQQHSKIIGRYKLLTDRESLLIGNVVKSLADLRSPYNDISYSEDEVRALIREAIQFFRKDNFKIYNDFKILKRLMRENLDQLDYFETGSIKRKKPAKKNIKELRQLESTGSRKQRLYPD